jgi:site-specific recombinase XerD
METALSSFRQFLERRYPGRATAKHYMSDLAIFSAFVGSLPLRTVTAKTIDGFVQSQSEQGLKAATINRRLSAISSLFDYLISEEADHGWHNPVFWKRHSVRQGRHLPRDVSDEIIGRLFAVIADSRDRAMFTMMLSAGLRVGEVATLKLEDMQPVAHSPLTRLRVCGKGDKERIVWLTAQAMVEVTQWLKDRPQAANSYLFLNQHGRPLSVAGIQYRLQEYCACAGIQLTCHQLRHTFARRLAEQKMPIDSLAKLLGHADLQTTQRYIDGADPGLRTDFLRAMAQYPTPVAPVSEQFVDITTALAPVEEQRQPTELLAAVAHLAFDLPEWLQATLCSHTLRRIPRWPLHRAKIQLRMHFGILCRICRWLIHNRHWQQLDGLQRTDLVAYLHARLAAGIKPRSVGAELTIFRMFWRDLLSQELVTNGALLQVKAPVAGDHLPRYLTPAEFQRLAQVLQAATAANTAPDIFNRTWFYLLAQTGVRLSELLNLRLGDCDLTSKRLRIVAGKGDRDRVLPLTDYLVALLQAYLVRREPASTDHLLLFHGAPVKPDLISARLQRFGTKAEINPMTPHRLRHTLATFLINQGMPITSLQKFLGHQDINKTLIYARVHNETVQQQFSAAMGVIEMLPVSNWPTQLADIFIPSAPALTTVPNSV